LELKSIEIEQNKQMNKNIQQLNEKTIEEQSVKTKSKNQLVID
jgi:hypothetical protein